MSAITYSTPTTGIQPPNVCEQVDNPFQFSVLTCSHKLLATKIICEDDKEVPFGKAKNFLFKYCEIDTLEDFAKALEWLSTEPRRFIIRGQLKPGLDYSHTHRRLLYPKDGEAATIDRPPRRWIVLDLDGVEVPHGLGAPDKMAEAGYFIRDNKLPAYFRGIRCVAAATASTGRKGPTIARLRLFFALVEAAPNDDLYAWCDGLSRRQPNLRLDPSVMLAMQPIYTARPIFRGMSDPIPPGWGRVTVLDGYEDYATLDLLPNTRHRERGNGTDHSWFKAGTSSYSPEALDLLENYSGRGVYPIEPTHKAWCAIKRVFEMLDGCPRPGGAGRHATLTKAAWELHCLVAEGELPEAMARDAYFEAAHGILSGDGKYDAAAIERRYDDAMADLCRRSTIALTVSR
jgi:hypothetical protein